MKTFILAAAAAGGLTALLAQSGNRIPLNVKTGLWQSTSTVTTTGALAMPPDVVAKMSPAQRAMYEAEMNSRKNGPAHTMSDTSKGCLTQDDLTEHPFVRGNQHDLQCQTTLLNSTSSDVEVHVTCTGMASLDYTMKIHAVDSEHTSGTGQGTATMGGQTMNSNFTMTSQWLGATCPADAGGGGGR